MRLGNEPWEWDLGMSLGKRALGMIIKNEPKEWAVGITLSQLKRRLSKAVTK